MAEFNYVVLGALVSPLLLLAACGGEALCQTTDYPSAPAGTAGTVHVSTGCPSDGADGSAAHPYPTIQEGVDHAQSGDAVLVAAGTYPENVSIARPVTVVGASPDSDPATAPVLVTAPAAFAITIAENTQAVQLFGLAVIDPVGVGVWVQPSAQATLMATRVEGAVAGGTQFGYGVLVDAGSIVLCKTAIKGSALAGVLVSKGSGTIEWSQIDDNQGEGGIRVESSSGMVNIHDNTLDGNEEVGIGVYSSTAVLMNNVITNTVATGTSNIGDGVVVAPLSGQTVMSSATLSGNTIQGSARAGVIFSGGSTGSITGNTITGNGFGAAFAAGNTISGNRYVGVGLTNAPPTTGITRATIANNTAVSDTKAAPVFAGVGNMPIGDGIEVFMGSYAAITSNMILGNGRFGILFDSADTGSTVTSNTISGSAQVGVVAQGQAAPDLSTDTLMNNMDGNSTMVAAGHYVDQTDNLALP
jgi:parallel beta-helix repeat protein